MPGCGRVPRAAASAYDDEKGWHTTSGSRSQSGSGAGNVGTTAGYGIVGGSGAGFSYEFSLNSTSGPTGTSTTSGSASATLSWSGTGDTGQTGGGITARARYGDGEGWQIVSVGPATTAGPEGVPGAGDLGTAAAEDDATFSGDESSRQGQAAPNGKGETAAVSTAQSWWHWFGGSRGDAVDQACNVAYGAGDSFTLNLSWLLRSGLTSDQADYNGTAYSAGGWAGFAADLATGAGVLKQGAKKLAREATEQVAKRTVAPARTLPNSTRGWKVGDPINKLTSKGNVPSWSTVRQRYWKNQAHSNAASYSAENLERMRRGLAPQRINPRTGQRESMELHHTPPQREGGLFDVHPVWPDDHALIDPFRNTGG